MKYGAARLAVNARGQRRTFDDARDGRLEVAHEPLAKVRLVARRVPSLGLHNVGLGLRTKQNPWSHLAPQFPLDGLPRDRRIGVGDALGPPAIEIGRQLRLKRQSVATFGVGQALPERDSEIRAYTRRQVEQGRKRSGRDVPNPPTSDELRQGLEPIGARVAKVFG